MSDREVERFVAFPTNSGDIAWYVDEDGRVYRSVDGQPFVRVRFVRPRDEDD